MRIHRSNKFSAFRLIVKSGQFGAYVLIAFMIAVCADIARASLSTQQVLLDLDGARQPSEWTHAIAELDALAPESRGALRIYAEDLSKDPQKRMLALRASLKSLTKSQSADELQKICVKEHDPNFRASCVMAMGPLHQESLIAPLKQFLTSNAEDGSVQLAAAVSLAIMGDSSGKDRAIQAISKAEPWSDSGIMALEILKAKDALPALQAAFLASNDYWVRNACRQAILRIQLAGADGKAQLDLLADVLREKGHLTHAQQWAARRLVQIGTKDAGMTLARAVKANDEQAGAPAMEGLRGGVEGGHWTKEETQKWLKP